MRENRKIQKKKEFVMVLLTCIICLSAIAIGTSAISKRNKDKSPKKEDIVDLNETTKVVSAEDETTNDSSTEKNLAANGGVQKNKETTTAKQQVVEKETTTQDLAAKVNAAVSKLSFNESSKLDWPIHGDVILDYNMENTIYFPTLDSYKCNPAIEIQGDDGMEVVAGVKGVVKTVGTDDEIGKYVVLSLGSGYELTYGQLKDVSVKEGESVEEKTTIATLNAPTKYFVKEGCNLYYKLTKDNEPTDPLNYLN